MVRVNRDKNRPPATVANVDQPWDQGPGEDNPKLSSINAGYEMRPAEANDGRAVPGEPVSGRIQYPDL